MARMRRRVRKSVETKRFNTARNGANGVFLGTNAASGKHNAAQARLPKWLRDARRFTGVQFSTLPSSEQSHFGCVDVEAVIAGDGSVDSNGLCAERGHFYSSRQSIAPHAMFKPNELDAQLFAGTMSEIDKFRTYFVPGESDNKLLSCLPSCTAPRTPYTMSAVEMAYLQGQYRSSRDLRRQMDQRGLWSLRLMSLDPILQANNFTGRRIVDAISILNRFEVTCASLEISNRQSGVVFSSHASCMRIDRKSEKLESRGRASIL
eukprot:IDg8267t1